MLSKLGFSRVLLLQGPMGPFFARLAEELRALGMEVHKLNLNAGDSLYYPSGTAYRGDLVGWPGFLERYLREQRIDGVLLFGDGRPYHRAAIEVARAAGVSVYVFEEGYLRPDWITLERDGVNGHSTLPRDPEFYATVDDARTSDRPVPVGQTFRYGAIHSTVYSLAMTLGFFLYPGYVHHRPLNAWAETYRWLLGGARKLWFKWKERSLLATLVNDHAKRFFLVALQVHCDYQLWHSKFRSVEEFIEHVVASFAEHASKEKLLVIKHHPMDRPYREYSAFMQELRLRYQLGSRLVYVHDLHLPTLLKHALGSVMINSTVGLQSLHAGTPVKVLGAAVYDIPGLTYQKSLDEFWSDQGDVDDRLYRRFRAHLLHTNQHNGSFYKRLPSMRTPTGVRWLALLLVLVVLSPALVARAFLGTSACAPGSSDCNPCAHAVEAQFAGLFSARGRWDVHAYRFFWRAPLGPLGIAPQHAVLRGWPLNRNHIQGFARTNSLRFPFVISHDNDDHGGVLAFIGRHDDQQAMAAIQRMRDVHPSGVHVIGRYVALADGRNVRLFDAENPFATAPTVVRPTGPGFSRAGGGLGLTKLADGRHLLLVSTPGSNTQGARFVRFFALHRPLSQNQYARFLGEWHYGQPDGWSRDYRYSENMTLITECGTGRLYAVHTSGAERLRGKGYFRLSRVVSGSAPELVTLRAYVHPQRQRSCHLRSAATSFVRRDHQIDLYCHERAANTSLGLQRRETVYFRRGHLTRR